MTEPHDEQPLTRRALRELERQKPRKQQKEEARAADAGQGAAGDVRVAPETVTPETVTPEAVVVPTEAVEVAAETGSNPTLSRRARRALSADHPFAGSEIVTAGSSDGHPEPDSANGAGPDSANGAGASGATASAATASTATASDASAPAESAPVTGPIIAELVAEDSTTGSTVVVDDPAPAEAESADVAASTGDDVIKVEELVVIDETAAPEVTAEEDEEFAEIDDTQAPDAVHIITIDDNPQAPILAPLFQAPPPEREIVPVEPSDVVSTSRFDDLIGSRGVGSSNIASTSALVLPSIPNHGDVGTALDETGEVIITGSIDLPMSLGSTGAAPADGLESADLDAYLDPDGDVGSDVAPVSATRAVSTHGASSGLVAPPKRGSATAPVVLAVVAGALAIGVVGLLFAAFVFRIF